MTAQQKSTSTIEKIRVMKDGRRRNAAETYRILLERNDHPKPNDAASLLEVSAVLGRTSDDLEADLGLVKALAEGESAELQALKLAGPRKKAKCELGEVGDRIRAEREESEERWREELGAADLAHRKIAAESQSLTQLASQVRDRRDEWAALVQGRSVAEVGADRRAVRSATATKPVPPPTRAQVIADARHEMAVLGYLPVVGSACDRIDGLLAVQGYAPLTEDEMKRMA